MTEMTKKITDAYEVIMREDLTDIGAEGILLKHRRSGARVMLLPCSDDNKVFSVSFRTPPADSTGVAHIIEHTVLCGSEAFPLKDPFVELVKGSLNTFLNAMTFPDKTMYPVASTNDADFRNLMHVYLDAVFRPEIYREKNIFRQEGWHYELENAESPLTLNGVVYNEMKGVFSSADSVLERETMNALFPDTAYGVESGGDPAAIPELTYEAYLDFHRRYYHPSNSYLYLYGDMDPEETLSFIDAEYLSHYEVQPVDSAVRIQAPFSGMKTVRHLYPVTDPGEEDSYYLSWNAVAGNYADMKEMLAYSVLDYALFSAPGAPVRQALINAGIGKDVYGEFNDGILQPYFSVIAKDVSAEDTGRFAGVLKEALEKEAEKGIERKALLAGINYLEFQFREADYGRYPKGLMYGMDVMDTWLYDDGNPFGALKRLDAFESLRKAAEEGYFEDLVRRSFLENPHSALVILEPKAGLMQEREAAVEAGLEELKKSLSDAELKQIADETAQLKTWQETPDSQELLETIPLLSRSDIRRKIRPFSNIPETVIWKDQAGTERKTDIVFHKSPANGIIYLDLLFDIRHIPAEDLPYAGLLKSLLMNMNTENYSYTDLNNEINSVTGGISCAISVFENADDIHDYHACFAVRGKALRSKCDAMMDLMSEIMLRTDYSDRKRLKEIISQTRIQLQTVLQQSGHTAAALRAGAYYSESSAFSEYINGISFYRFIKDLEEHFDECAGSAEEKLRALAGMIFRGDLLTVSCTSEEEDFETVRALIGRCTPEEGKDRPEKADIPVLGKRNEGFKTAGQVQFVAMGGFFADRGIPYTGDMMILRQILSYEYLWQNVRVLGGAYGCGGSLRKTGDGVFTSYRDPHLKRTKEIFEGIPDYLRSFDADERTMTKFIIGTMSSVDQPLTPAVFGSLSMHAYISGTTDEERQRNRNQILDATAGSIRKLADAAEAVLKNGCICVIGGEQMIEKDRDVFLTVENLL